jgi:hypothetical protein
MRGYLLISILFIFLTSCRQYNIPDVVENRKTDKHLLVSGTRLYLIPSNDIDIENNHIKLSNSSNIKLSVKDIINEDFFRYTASISKEYAEANKVNVILFKQFFIDTYNAKVLIVQKNGSKERAYTLAFGDTTFSLSMFCTYPAYNKKLESEIIKTSLTAVYDKNIKDDPFQYSRFTVDLDSSNFKYNKSTLDNYFFTTSNNPDDDNEASFFIIKQLKNNNPTYDSLKAINDNLLNSEKKVFQFSSIKIEAFRPLKINGCNVIEMYGYANVDNRKVLIYNFIIGKNDNILTLNAYVPKEYEKHLAQIQKISNSLKLK